MISPERSRPVRHMLDAGKVGNPLGPSPLVEQRLSSFRELPGDQEKLQHQLQQRLARWLGIAPGYLALSAGSDALIDVLGHLLAGRVEQAIVPIPTYFHIIDVLVGEKIAFHTSSALPRLALPNIGAVPSLVWSCNPNNPTGTAAAPKHLLSCARENPNSTVVVDEAYWEMIDPDNQQSLVRAVPVQPNLIVTKTFSKAFGLPDARVGYVVAHPAFIEQLRPYITTPTARGMAAALAALDDSAYLHACKTWHDRELIWFARELGKIPDIEILTTPDVGIFMVRHKDWNLGVWLRERGIETVDLNNTAGIKGRGFVRIGLKKHDENVLLLNVLKSG